MSTKLVSVLKKRTITFKPEDEVLNNEEALLLQNLKRPRSNSPPTANESMDDPTFSSQTRQSNSPPPAYRNVNTVPRTQSHNKVLHVGICPGDLASRVLLIGDSHRAAYLASHLSPRKSDGSQLFISSSSKGYTTYTGTYLGIDISIVSFGMGVSMIDFFVREGRDVAPKGPMVIVAYGSSGGLQRSVKPGSLAVIEDSVLITRNPDAWTDESSGSGCDSDESQSFYTVSKPIVAHAGLVEHMKNELNFSKPTPSHNVVSGLSATADSFYSSQGRIDSNFDDHNGNLVAEVSKKHPNIINMEMESFHLLDLARCTLKSSNKIAACAVAVVVATRPTGEVADTRMLAEVEAWGGKAILRGLANIEIQNLFKDTNCEDFGKRTGEGGEKAK